MIAQKHLDMLKFNDLFKGISIKNVPLSFDGKYVQEYKEGEFIYSAGEDSDFVYLITAGEVKIKNASTKKLTSKYLNDYFGEKDLLANSKRNTTALANIDCILYKIPKEDFVKLLKDSPQVLANVKGTAQEKEEDLSLKFFGPSLDLDKETEKVDLAELVFEDVKEESYSTAPDIDQIEVPKFHRKPDLDKLMFNPTADDDNRNLKQELITDPSEQQNWIITEAAEALPEENVASEAKTSILNDEPLIPKAPPVEIDLDSAANTSLNLKKFVDISNNFKVTYDLSETVRSILSNLLILTDSEAGTIFLFDNKTSDLVLKDSTDSTIKKFSFKFFDGLSGKSVAAKKAYFITNPKGDLRFSAKVDYPFRSESFYAIYLPFVDSEMTLLGFAQLFTNKTSLNEKDFELIRSVSLLSAHAIKKSRFLLTAEDQKQLDSISAVSKFLSEDIKSPVLTIKHYASIISRFDVPEELRRIITLLTMQANSVMDLVQSVSDYADKKLQVKTSVTELNETLNNILDLVSEYGESKNVKLLKKLSDDAKVNIDPRKFHVAIYQIMKFTCKELSSGGKIYFSTLKNGNNVNILINKEGKTNGEFFNEDIFDSDLSLSVARYYVEGMKGKLFVQEDEKKNSLFVISFPIISN